MTQPAPDPVVSGTGGGTGARVAALATAVALVVVVWAGVAGRPPAPAPAPVSPRPIAAGPSATSSLTTSPDPTTSPSQTPPGDPPPASPSRAPDAAGTYVIAGLIGGTSFRTELTEIAPGAGKFSARYAVPDPRVREGTLAFEITPSRGSARSRGDTLGVFLLDIDSLAANHRSGLEGHRAVVAGRPKLTDAPLPVRSGFELGVSVALAFDRVAMVDFELHVAARERGSIQGNDGVMGCLPFDTCDAED